MKWLTSNPAFLALCS